MTFRWLEPAEFFGYAYDTPRKFLWMGKEPPDVPCHGCRGSGKWWRATDGHWVCGLCHPKAGLPLEVAS